MIVKVTTRHIIVKSVFETYLSSCLSFDWLGSFENQQNNTKQLHLRSWRTDRIAVSRKSSAVSVKQFVISEFSFLFSSFKARVCIILWHDFAADNNVHVTYQTRKTVFDT